MGNQVTGDNAQLFYSTSLTGGSFTQFANIEEITGPKVTSPVVKVTKLDSVAEMKQAGLPDYGSISAKIRWLKSLANTILGFVAGKTPLAIQAVVLDNASTNSGTVTALGFIKEFDPVGQLVNNKEVLSDIVFEINGTLGLS